MIEDKRIAQLQDKHFHEWLKMRARCEAELSEKQSVFCVCGRLATGMHERNCRRFQNTVTSETVKRLEHLLSVEEEKP